ncbi:MAG: ATP12 family protein [Pseudomonadota bacterium]
MKRFWTQTRVAAVEGGFELRLDTRPIRTPGKRALILPTATLAEAMAAEWEAQGETVDPRSMPVTRSANTAIDRVAPERAAVVGTVAAYGETDLLCYRAPHPDRLIARQAAVWDPLLDWAAEAYGARLQPAAGVMFSAQDPEATARLRAAVETRDAWALTALHELVTLSGSLVIGLAVAEGRLSPDEGWAASRVEEDWNIAEWGEDAEAAAQAARREADFHEAARFLMLLCA